MTGSFYFLAVTSSIYFEMCHYLMFEILVPIGKMLLPYVNEISTALVACFLVVFGSDINRLMRKLLSGRHFITRTIAFIFLNAFGYSLIIIYATPAVVRALYQAPADMRFISVICAFIAIGLWAQRNRQV